MLDAEWIKAKVIADLNAAKAEIEANSIFVYPHTKT
jgi:hypothetical protein